MTETGLRSASGVDQGQPSRSVTLNDGIRAPNGRSNDGMGMLSSFDQLRTVMLATKALLTSQTFEHDIE